MGVAVEAVDETVEHEILEMIKAEANKRSLRKKKKGVHKGNLCFCIIFQSLVTAVFQCWTPVNSL